MRSPCAVLNFRCSINPNEYNSLTHIMTHPMRLAPRKIADPAARTLMAHALTGAIGTRGLQKILRKNHNRASRRLILRALSSCFFPIHFFARNLETLATEPGWQRLPLRSRTGSARRLLLERSRFFLEVKAWREDGRLLLAAPPVPAEPVVTSQGLDMATYCDHCGACCEIASGLPEFHGGTPVPSRWQHVFGQGLGRWHRFCPFLWEDRSTRHSLCAIHPWRPLACRAFEQDECDFLKGDSAELKF
jgi:hypothetical protein